MAKMKWYKITCGQFNRLVEINKRYKDGEADAARYIENRNNRFYGKKNAIDALKSYKGSTFYDWLFVVDENWEMP